MWIIVRASVVILICIIQVLGQKSDEERLWNDLRGKSDLKFKPGGNKTINIGFGISLNTLHDYNPRTAMIEVSYYMRFLWKNELFRWDPKLYGGLKSMHISPSKIWVPDIVPYRHKGTKPPIVDVLVILNSGTVIWVPPLVSKFACQPDTYSQYPNDIMTCSVSFGSWTYHGFDLILTLDADAKDYLTQQLRTKSLERLNWKFLNASIERYNINELNYTETINGKTIRLLCNLKELSLAEIVLYVFTDRGYESVVYENFMVAIHGTVVKIEQLKKQANESSVYSCCEEPYHSVELKVNIQRNFKYFALTTTAPEILSGLFIAILYLLPPLSTARITSQTICLLLVTYIGVSQVRIIGPTTKKAPLAFYFIGAMVLDFLAVCWSVVAAVLWTQTFRSGHTVEQIAKTITSALGTLCCLPSALKRDNLYETAEGSGNVMNRTYLSPIQGLCLILDKLFCLFTLIIFLILYFHLRSAAFASV